MRQWKRELVGTKEKDLRSFEEKGNTAAIAVLGRLSECRSKYAVEHLAADFFFMDCKWNPEDAARLRTGIAM